MATILSLQQGVWRKLYLKPTEENALISDLGHRLQFASKNQVPVMDEDG